VSGFGPNEGFWMTVIEFEMMADAVLRFPGAAMDAAAQLFFGEVCEPALDQVEARRRRRGEVQTTVRMTQQPTLDRRGL